MGVDRSDYILIGSKINVSLDDDFFEDNYDKYFSQRKHEVGNIAYLDEPYSGEYFIVGIPLKVDSEGYNGIGYSAYDIIEVNPKHAEMADEVKEHVKKTFGIDCEPKLIVLTHFT